MNWIYCHIRKLNWGGLILFSLCLCQPAVALECTNRVQSTAQFAPSGTSFGNLWRVENGDGKINHIFATIHLSDPRISQLQRHVNEALNSSTSFGMEVVLDRDALTSMSSAMQLVDGQSLKMILQPDLFTATALLLDRRGVSAQATERLKPWAAFVTLSLPPMQPGVPLDMVLMLKAQRAGIPIFGLETVDEQIAVFDRLSAADEVELLRELVCHYDDYQSDIATMTEHYIAEDLDAVMQMALRYRSPLQDRFLDVLLWQRNRRMVAKMLPHLETGGAFIALGALHLPGSGGVLDLLNRRGYTVQAIR